MLRVSHSVAMRRHTKTDFTLLSRSKKKIQELIKLFLIPGGAKNPKSEKKEANMLKEEKRKHKNRDKDKENIDSHKSTEHSEYLIF